MAKCATTHHACDCQIEWRREAEALLRDVWTLGCDCWHVWRDGGPECEGMCLSSRARRLLDTEDKPDA